MVFVLDKFLHPLEWKDRLSIYREDGGLKLLREAKQKRVKGVKGVKLLLEAWSKRAKLLGEARQREQASWRS